jgi:hypothetical protein
LEVLSASQQDEIFWSGGVGIFIFNRSFILNLSGRVRIPEFRITGECGAAFWIPEMPRRFQLRLELSRFPDRVLGVFLGLFKVIRWRFTNHGLPATGSLRGFLASFERTSNPSVCAGASFRR